MKKLLLIILLSFIGSCKYGNTFSQLDKIRLLKKQVEYISGQDLSFENQKILKDYFSSIKDLSYEFLNNKSMQNYTHIKFLKFFNESICKEAILDKSYYLEIMNKCTVNSFYICSEEVKLYKEILLISKKLFNEKEINKILSELKCKNILNELGLFHE